MREVTIVGGGLARPVAATPPAGAGARVRVLEARDELGGRAKSTTGEYTANPGPHALYSDGALWAWLQQRRLTRAVARPPARGMRWHLDGKTRALPPMGMLARAVAARGRCAPVNDDFRTWFADVTDEVTAARLAAASGVFAFTHDPGALSASFVWERAKRVLLRFPPAARYPLGGWQALVERLSRHASILGVRIEHGCRVTALPDPPVIIATDLPTARGLLNAPDLRWESGHTLCLDLGLVSRRGDPFIVSDLDNAGWIERFSAADPSLAPKGHELIQAQIPVRPSETADEAQARLERVLDGTFSDWRARHTWDRRLIMRAQTGALDRPGSGWRDRPAIDRGNGIFLAGDMVAAPGLLAEVSANSAVEAATRAASFPHRGRPAATRALPPHPTR